MPLTIRVSEHSQSTGSDRTPSEHTDDEEYAGVPVDSTSTGSQVDYSDRSAEDELADEYVHVRHIRAETARERVRRQSRASYDDDDDIEPSDSASRPDTSRQSSQRRHPDASRGQSRRRNPAPEPPPLPRQPREGAPRIPREPLREPRPRPESLHSDSLDYDDYPGGYGGLPYRPGPGSQWGHVPHFPYGEPSVMTGPPRGDGYGRGGGDVMSYRDPYYDEHNPFAARGPVDDFYDARPPQRPRPAMRHSVGPGGYGAMMPYRDPYGYDPYRDYWGRRGPPPPPERVESPPKEPSKQPTPVAMPPVPMPIPVPSPGDERLAKLEELILQQTKANERRIADKMALREEENRKKKEAEEKSQSEKLAALEKLLLKQNEEAIAREKAMEAKQKAAEASAAARMAKEAAERAATEKIAMELQAAAKKAKDAAEKKAEEEAKKAKDAADKEIAAIKEKHEAAEAAKKKAEEEAEKLKPKKVDPPIRFKDAVGRKFSFPYDICKSWKGMENLIKQAFLHVDLLGPHVLEGHYDLIGPDGEIILPQVWDTMIKPDFSIEMQMWPIPELEKGKGPPHGMPGAPPGGLPSIDELLKGMGGGPPGASSKKIKGKKGSKIAMPMGARGMPMPPMHAIPPPPDGMIPPPPLDPLHVLPGGPGPAGLAAAMAAANIEGGRPKPKKKKEVPMLMRWAANSAGAGKKK